MHFKQLLAGLNGPLCVYKSAEISLSALKRLILRKICAEGNDIIVCAKPPKIKIQLVEPHPETGALVVTGLREQMDYMYHPLVSGEELRIEDLRLEEAHPMEPSSSGVCVLGLNEFCDRLPELMSKSWLNHYRIEGMLGRKTLNHEIKGKVTLKCNYDHVTKYQMSKLLSTIQSHYRKMSFEAANVDLQSRQAFELARKGIPRAQLPGVSIIYSLELDSFDPPYFAIHLQAYGETDKFLRYFIHELGVSLGSTASCVRLQRRSFGPFDADTALLDKQLSLQNMLCNIGLCRKILNNTTVDPDVVTTISPERHLPTDLIDGLGLHDVREEDAMRPAWPRNY